MLKNKIESYLEDKLKTKVDIGALDYRLPQWISLKKIYIEDRNKDTLLSGDEIRVDIKMLKLINGETDIEKVFLSNVYAKIKRPATDSTFNYQFIIDAFDSGSEQNNIKDTSSLKISLAKLTRTKNQVCDGRCLCWCKYDGQSAGTEYHIEKVSTR
ncbi:MAG: hypothetical protein V9E88_01790 [Ferruginibacter sp.]